MTTTAELMAITMRMAYVLKTTMMIMMMMMMMMIINSKGGIAL